MRNGIEIWDTTLSQGLATYQAVANEEHSVGAPVSRSLLWLACRTVVPPFFLSRSLIFSIIVVFSQIAFVTVPAREGVNYHPYAHLDIESIVHSLKKVFRSADGAWYLGIAESGYTKAPFTKTVPHNWTLFPLFPVVVSIGSYFVPKMLTIALMINAAAFYLGLVGLYLLARMLSHSHEQAERAVWLCCFFPTSFFMSNPTSEALFFLAIVFTFLFVRQQRPLSAAVCMLLAGSCRMTGLFLMPAFFLALLESKQLPRRRGLCALAIAPLGTIAFCSYLYFVSGNPLAFIDNQVAWGRQETIVQGIEGLWKSAFSSFIMPWNFVALNTLYFIIGCAASIYLACRKQWSHALVLLLPLSIAILSGTVSSMGRYLVPLFPFYLVLSAWASSKNLERTVLVVSAMLLSLYVLGYTLHVTAAMV